MLMVVRLVLAALLGLVVVAPAAFYGSTSDGADGIESTVITSYDATFVVDEAGDMSVTEVLDVEFPGWESKRGIFRFFDVVDPNDSSARRSPQGFNATRDGMTETVHFETRGLGRYEVARMGEESRVLSAGIHRYTLRYTIEDVLEDGTDGFDTQFYWNLIPGGWAQSIREARLTVVLPAEARGVQCAVGTGAIAGCEQVKGRDTRTLVITTGPLQPRTPVTVKLGLDTPTPESDASVPWPAALDPVVGRDPLILAGVGTLALVALLLGFATSRGVHEPTPPYPLMYAPPEGIGPAQAAYLLTERTRRSAYVASILEAARHGAVTLRRDESGWDIQDAQGEEGWRGLDEVTAMIGRLPAGPGRTFVARRSSKQAGQKLKSELDHFESMTRLWATRTGHIVPAGLGSAGGLTVLLAFAAALLIVFVRPFGFSAMALVPGLYGIGALAVLTPGASTRRTATGRDLWSRIGGFRRVLSTPSSVERFDFSGRQELYTAYIPWAVAFGVADQWAAKYRFETGEEPPIPTYFGGTYAGVHTGNWTSLMVNDFNSAVDSAISTYNASVASSSGGSGFSGGGGGFSGGGGGGGGGGGSW